MDVDERKAERERVKAAVLRLIALFIVGYPKSKVPLRLLAEDVKKIGGGI